MITYRLTHPDYATDLSGAGNKKHGARWNSPGRGVVYTSSTLSLCVLESYVHIPALLRHKLPLRTSVKIQIPDDAGIATIEKSQLPKRPNTPEGRKQCRELGDAWLSLNKELVLIAPSIILGEENNIMINPAHEAMKHVTILECKPFTYDQRLSG